MEKVWFISDLHLNHRNIIPYCARPFESVEEMNEVLIENWNKRVKNGQRVFCLGDFALCERDKIIELGQRLNGRKILVFGNHDGASIESYRLAGFEQVSRYPLLFGNLMLSHTPLSWCPYVNVHGHIHNKRIEDCTDLYKGILANYINVSADVTNFAPIELEELVVKIKERQMPSWEFQAPERI